MKEWNNPFVLVVIVTLVAMKISPVYAHDEMEALFSMSLHELSEVNVSIASRVEESFIDAPSSVTVITRQQIDQLGVRTLTELLNFVPGFQSYMSPHESNGSLIMVRGLADIYGQNVLLMIDGRRINDEYTGGFTFANHQLSLYNVKQVEIIRGPGSALYGSNALSGVINLITEQRKELVVSAGSNQAAGVTASTFGRAGEFDISASFDYYQDGGQNYAGLTDRNGFGKSTKDSLQVFQGTADISYKRSRLTVEYMNTQLSDYYVFRRISNDINSNDTQRLGVYLEHDFEMTDNWQGSGRIGFLRHERKQQALLSPTDTQPFNDEWQQDTREAQLDFSYLTRIEHQLSMGVYLGYMDIPIALNTFEDRFVLDESRRTTGVYLQDQFYIQDDLRLTASLRYDDYSDFGDTLNPRLALLYRLNERDSFKFMYGRAYRAPSMGDLYDTESLVGGGNLFLDPVIVNTYELAYLFSANENDLIFTWFFNDYEDFIATHTTPTGFMIDNIYDNQTQGVELELRWGISHHWSTHTSLTHIFSTDTDVPSGVDITLPEDLTPKTYGNVQLNYQRRSWNWNISVVAHDGINVLEDDGIVSVVNSKVVYQLNHEWDMSLNVRNLLDEDYSTPQSRVIGQDAAGNDVQEYPSRGREIFVSLRFSPDN